MVLFAVRTLADDVVKSMTAMSTELQHLCYKSKAFAEAVCSMLYQGKEQ